MNSKFCSLLGFARKSGNLIIGYDNIEKKISKSKLLISACDIAERTSKNIEKLGLPLIKTDLEKSELGRIIGCKDVSVVAVIDENFSESLKNNQ